MDQEVLAGTNTLPFAAFQEQLLSKIPDANALVWLLFYLILAYTVLHAVIFVYHWHLYNIAPSRFLAITYILYFVGIALFLGMLLFTTIGFLS